MGKILKEVEVLLANVDDSLARELRSDRFVGESRGARVKEDKAIQAHVLLLCLGPLHQLLALDLPPLRFSIVNFIVIFHPRSLLPDLHDLI